MLRGLILLLLIGGVALLAAPFLLSSFAVDERGITIPGRVYAKSEYVTVRYSNWSRSAEVTFRYEPPDVPGVQFVKTRLPLEQYDGFHVGDTASLRYLRRTDVPAVPMSNTLLQLHALPVVRLASSRTGTNLKEFFNQGTIKGVEIMVSTVILLIVLRISRSPLFGWVLGISIAVGFGLVMLYEFPKPMPKPSAGVRQTAGRVASLDRIDRLFSGSRSRGAIADQPVDVVGIEFVPEGRSDSVLAVDLIDGGSVTGLKVDSTVAIEYEANSPRTAYIQPATRTFVSRNVNGIVVQGILGLAVLIGGFLIAQRIGRAFNRLIRRSDVK